MKIIETVKEMQKFSGELRLKKKRIGFVPTMGYLHSGHLSLVKIARENSDFVIMSIFVNPTQFGPDEDFEKYPRDLKRDEELAKNAGTDLIFYPLVKEMYPENYLTYVEVENLGKKLCGISRPIHFRGVTTVVSKLFNIVKPHIAVFGQKDAQQTLIIKKMVRDLNFDIKIIVAPIVRESDGLAMSSRNVYLSPSERKEALCLYESLQLAKNRIDSGEKKSEKIISEMRKIIKQKPSAKIDYVSMVDTETLEDKNEIKGETLIAVAVWIGKTRLIDNIIINE
jgi:pantoate--beta-alanine ligase